MGVINLWLCSDKDNKLGVTQIFCGGEAPERDTIDGVWCYEDDPIGRLYEYHRVDFEKKLGVKIPNSWEDEPLKLILSTDDNCENIKITNTKDGTTENYTSFL